MDLSKVHHAAIICSAYRRDKDGVRLEPANPNYPVIRLRPGQELDYFGKVTACIHRFAGKR